MLNNYLISKFDTDLDDVYPHWRHARHVFCSLSRDRLSILCRLMAKSIRNTGSVSSGSPYLGKLDIMGFKGRVYFTLLEPHDQCRNNSRAERIQGNTIL
jgi:hypothetical protein